jgi:fumarate hydratase subunit alpha
MKKIPFDDVVAKVKEMSMAANFDLGKDVVVSIEENMKREESSIGREVLAQILQNQEIARNEKIGLCQDTGLAVFFIDMGDEVSIEGGNIRDAVNEGVRQGYGEGYLRKSVCHPFTRKNTGDNTPAVLHIDLVPGDSLKITMAPKGGGSENMSRVMMLKPSDGKEGIIDYVVQRVKESGANPCPPIIVGVGIGGTYEIAALIAKKALLREVGSKNSDPELAEMEAILLSKINNLGIGPQGLGGRTTALAVHINMLPCHIASLPLAVNLNCHSHRHKEYI